MYIRWRAYLEAFLYHFIRGHKVHWDCTDPEHCAGDLVCEDCDLILWCRAVDR